MEQVAAQHGAPKPPLTKGCESRRRLVRIVPPIYGLWHCYTHSSCVCNDVISAVNRVVGEVPLPTRAGVRMVRDAIKKLWHPRQLAPLNLVDSLATFKGSKNKLYTKAYESLLVEPLREKDGRIKSFVKAEKFNSEDKVNPDPRMIQARDPRYNLHLACYLRGIEKELYGLKIDGLPVIVKCKNPRERADLLMQKWALMDDAVCVSLDCSRWDKHVDKQMLDLEHEFYMSWYVGDDMLRRLLQMQRKNVCVTSNGVKYTVDGGRMSGDMNTASGNCLLAVADIVAAMKRLCIRRYQVICDGDDLLLLVNRSDLARVKAELPGVYLLLGQELKVENVAYELQDVIFCQSKMTYGADGWTFARNWRKVLSQSCCGTKHWNDPNVVPGMFGVLGDCEMALSRGIPILQAFAEALRRNSGGARMSLSHLDSSYQYRISSYGLSDIKRLMPAEITAKARFEFERTWGVDPSTQMAIEEHLKAWAPGIVCRDVPIELTAECWEQRLDPSVPQPTVL